MPRLSELIRKPSITLESSQLANDAPYIWESDQPLEIPRLENFNGAVVPIQADEPDDTGTLVDLVKNEFASLDVMIARDECLSIDGMRAIAFRLVQDLQQSEQILAQVFAPRPSLSRRVSHSLNVAVLATKLGIGLHYNPKDLLDVATVALVQDVEQLVVPGSCGSKTHKRGIDKAIHHEILPDGLQGAAIHEYAQVIGLANRFEMLINEKGLTAHEAMRHLLTKEKTAFRGQLLKTLVQQISLFPVGTMVRLNTGEVGTVEQTNPAHPLRPILRMAPGDHRAASEVIPLKDLSQDKLVNITEILNNTNE